MSFVTSRIFNFASISIRDKKLYEYNYIAQIEILKFLTPLLPSKSSHVPTYVTSLRNKKTKIQKILTRKQNTLQKPRKFFSAPRYLRHAPTQCARTGARASHCVRAYTRRIAPENGKLTAARDFIIRKLKVYYIRRTDRGKERSERTVGERNVGAALASLVPSRQTRRRCYQRPRRCRWERKTRGKEENGYNGESEKERCVYTRDRRTERMSGGGGGGGGRESGNFSYKI